MYQSSWPTYCKYIYAAMKKIDKVYKLLAVCLTFPSQLPHCPNQPRRDCSSSDPPIAPLHTLYPAIEFYQQGKTTFQWDDKKYAFCNFRHQISLGCSLTTQT